MTTNPEPQDQADASLGEIKRQIIYKGQGQHCEVQLAHQFYPSSKTCSNCSGVMLRDGKALTVGTPHGETSPDQRACQRHTTVHQTGQKTGHRSLQQAVSYSEIPLQSSGSWKTAISPSRNPAHHFRRLFDDSHALFVLNSVHTFGYNGNYPNIRSCYDAFTNRSENRSEKRPGIGSWQAIPW